LRALCKAAGVPQIHCHALRHTQASLAYLATGDMLAVAARLGHSSVTVTMGIYAHLLRTDAATATALDNLLNGKADGKQEGDIRS
jgi:integrase